MWIFSYQNTIESSSISIYLTDKKNVKMSHLTHANIQLLISIIYYNHISVLIQIRISYLNDMFSFIIFSLNKKKKTNYAFIKAIKKEPGRKGCKIYILVYLRAQSLIYCYRLQTVIQKQN